MKKAFTLAEIIITITLLTSLSLFSIPVAVSYLQGSDADTVSRQIVNDLMEVQQNSFTKKSKTFGSSTDICTGVSFTNLSSQRSYTIFEGTWNSSTYVCNNRTNLPKKLIGRSDLTNSVDEFIFLPGNFRPITLGTVSISGNTVTGTGTPDFTNILATNDSVALLSTPSTCVTASSITSTTLTTSSNLGNGSNQTLIKCINVSVKNNSSVYKVYVTDEGMVYYSKIQ